jgi:triphosphoribosyl-dephospho-CoA synthetase
MNTFSTNQLEQFYLQACEIELQAFKPGNVSIYADGHDMTVEDFRRSARVSATPLCDKTYSLGEKIYYSIKDIEEAREEILAKLNSEQYKLIQFGGYYDAKKLPKGDE